MRNIVPSLIGFLIISLSFTACEKDDICVDNDTPALVIRFYDATDETSVKPVTNLRITGIGATAPLSNADRITTDSVVIPLKSFDSTTGFIFTFDSADDDNNMETGNSDSVTFTYTTREVFVSRACGYITNFEGLNASFQDDGDNWISKITVESTDITNENAAHVKIFH